MASTSLLLHLVIISVTSFTAADMIVEEVCNLCIFVCETFGYLKAAFDIVSIINLILSYEEVEVCVR